MINLFRFQNIFLNTFVYIMRCINVSCFLLYDYITHFCVHDALKISNNRARRVSHCHSKVYFSAHINENLQRTRKIPF